MCGEYPQHRRTSHDTTDTEAISSICSRAMKRPVKVKPAPKHPTEAVTKLVVKKATTPATKGVTLDTANL